MKEEGSNHIYSLIGKYLTDQANNAEKLQVEDWIHLSELNRREFEQMQEIWKRTGTLAQKQLLNVNVDDAWVNLQQRIQNDEAPIRSLKKENNKRSAFFYISRVAAIILLCFAAYLLFQLTANSVKEIHLVASENVLFDTLSDHSIIALNKNSRLSFPEKFEGSKRLVQLNGEAFFDVQPNPQKAFIVKVNGAEIRVLGTSFLVQAFDSLDYVKVSVKEGRVKVASEIDSIVLSAGQSIRLNKISKNLEEVKAYQSSEIYWMTNTLLFQDQGLAEVFESLEKHFKIRIEAKNEKILNCRLTAKFEDKSIDRIFEIIAASFELTIEIENNKYILSGEGCD